MSEAIYPSELRFADRRRRASRRSDAGLSSVPATQAPASPASDIPVVPDARTGIAAYGELERLCWSLSAVPPENHPCTAQPLASSTRKAAQKVIEEAGEVGAEAVKHHPRGIGFPMPRNVRLGKREQDRDTRQTPPLEHLPPARLSPLNRDWMAILRAYPAVAAGLVLLRVFRLATMGA